MSIITRTYTFQDGTTAYGSQVESEIGNITTTLNSLDSAGLTWTNVKVTTLLPQANVNMASHKITSLAQGTVAGDAVAYEQLANVNPTGSLLMYFSKTAPTGYLYCDGSAVNRGSYAALYAAVGNAFGSGDGASTFNLPDYRGKFLRGVNDSSGNDPDASSRTAQASGGNSGDAVGSIQAGANASHTHTANVTDPGHTHTWINTTGSGGASDGANAPKTNSVLLYNVPVASNTTGITVANVATGGNESRPINAAIYFHIKI